jgi:hypothetical protein
MVQAQRLAVPINALSYAYTFRHHTPSSHLGPCAQDSSVALGPGRSVADACAQAYTSSRVALQPLAARVTRPSCHVSRAGRRYCRPSRWRRSLVAPVLPWPSGAQPTWLPRRVSQARRRPQRWWAWTGSRRAARMPPRTEQCPAKSVGSGRRPYRRTIDSLPRPPTSHIPEPQTCRGEAMQSIGVGKQAGSACHAKKAEHTQLRRYQPKMCSTQCALRLLHRACMHASGTGTSPNRSCTCRPTHLRVPSGAETLVHSRPASRTLMAPTSWTAAAPAASNFAE